MERKGFTLIERERLDRIEKRLEDIVRPMLQIRSTGKKLLARVEAIEADVRRLQS